MPIFDLLSDIEDFAIGPLRDCPILIETLDAFLGSGLNSMKTAKQLRRHRHTIGNRLSRIEELTTLRLDDRAHRVLFELALWSRASKATPEARPPDLY